MTEPAAPADTRSTDVRVSEAMQWIATNLEQAIADVAGERVAFALVVFTQPRTNYIANATRELCVQEIKRLLELWEQGMPDIPAHETQ